MSDADKAGYDRRRSIPFACVVGATTAFLAFPASFLLLEIARYGLPTRSGIPLSSIPWMAIGVVPYILIWLGSLPLLSLLPGERRRQFGWRRCTVHAAVCGLLYYLFAAALLYDPDKFGSLHNAPNFFAYSLMDWELYPIWGGAGVLCGAVFSMAYAGASSYGREA